MSSQFENHRFSTEKSTVIFVEGINFERFLNQRIENDPEFANVSVFHFDQNGKVGRLLRIAKAQDEFPDISALGIISDINNLNLELSERLPVAVQNIRGALNGNGLSCPENPGLPASSSRGKPTVAYLLLPTGQESGCLEHCLIDSISDKYGHYRDCVEVFIECTAQERLNENTRAKAKVGAVLAGYYPELTMTRSGNPAYSIWDWEKPELKVILDFIKGLDQAGKEID